MFAFLSLSLMVNDLSQLFLLMFAYLFINLCCCLYLYLPGRKINKDFKLICIPWPRKQHDETHFSQWPLYIKRVIKSVSKSIDLSLLLLTKNKNTKTCYMKAKQYIWLSCCYEIVQFYILISFCLTEIRRIKMLDQCS